jgi:hypothetical protein
MARSTRKLLFALTLLLFAPASASAQFIGTFTWKQEPYCNVVVLNVTQVGTVFSLDGYDDQCGAATRASVVGAAFQNPNGTIGMAMTVVGTPGAAPVHIDARITLPTLNGDWADNSTASGTFVFNGAGGGAARPLNARSSPIEITATSSSAPEIRLNGGDSVPDIVGYRVAGSLATPFATSVNSTLVNIGGGGFDGTNFTGATGQIYAYSREQFTATARGTALFFATTPNGSAGPTTRMLIEHNGNVGIGTTSPLELLHVNGDVRIGSCVYETDGGVSCLSDEQFKRGIRPVSFALDRVAALQPVRYSWRTDEFPDRHFDTGESVGLVAQDVERVLPELVSTDAHGYKAVDYSKLPLVTIQAVKELKERNDRLTEQNAALERRLEALEAAITRR